MRLATVFKRLLRLARERVVAVELIERAGRQLLVVELVLPKRRRAVCSGCGEQVAAS